MSAENSQFKFAPYSYSRLSTFESCPLKFKFTYIDKLSGTERNSVLDKGSYLHHCLELYPNKPYTFFDIPEEKLRIYDSIIEEFLHCDLGKMIFFNDDSITIGKELDFALDSTLMPCEFNSEKALLRGSIDRLNYNVKDNILEVYDYKSGKYREPRFQTFDQVMMYAIWIFRNPLFRTVEKVRTSYVYIEHKMENVLVMERQYIKHYLTNYINKIKGPESCSEFSKNETKLCDWCDFRKVGICN